MKPTNAKFKVEYRRIYTNKRKKFALADFKRQVVEIDKRITGKLKLGCILHESLHLIFPEKSESEILNAERRIRETLWAEGCRMIERSERKKFSLKG